MKRELTRRGDFVQAVKEDAMGYSTATAATSDSRQRSRRMLLAQLRSARFGSGLVTVRDISPGGLGGTTNQWLRAGERVEAHLPNIGTIPGRIAWTNGQKFGLQFDDEIDADQVMRERVPTEIENFRVADRFRPELSAKRPAIGLR
jgi:hypothetical protein